MTNQTGQPIETFMTNTGEKVAIRFIGKQDAALLVEMFHRLSPESKRLRFHLYTTRVPQERIWQVATRLSDLDSKSQVGLLATVIEGNDRECAVGVAHLMRATLADKEAEVAVVVRDDFQRRGLGKRLLLLLAEQARSLGITHFTGWVVADNVRLMKLIKNLELKDVESELRYGERKIRVKIVEEE